VSTEPVDAPEAHSSPVLDIGGEVGAMVVYLAAGTRSGELEACPVDAPDARFHTGVHHRAIAHGFAWTAVFPEVAEGAYHLLDAEGGPLAAVTVTGGRVAELDLR
jgi:hypothetical protein